MKSEGGVVRGDEGRGRGGRTVDAEGFGEDGLEAVGFGAAV